MCACVRVCACVLCQCSGLELQLWSRDEEQLQEESGEEKASGWCVGKAVVDVSALACGLPRISGWYHVYSLTGQVQGQLKVQIDRTPVVVVVIVVCRR